jgi:branched-subunit amino acid transport protein AzlD
MIRYRRISTGAACGAYARGMGRYLPLIIVALLTIYCVVEVAQAQPYAVRRAPRWLWATAIICLPLIGAVTWLFLGRPTAATIGKPSAKAGRPKAPDDDVDFLRGL